MTTAPTMTATDLALEMAMAIHLSAGNLLDQRDELIQQRIWLQNELDNVGAG